MKMLLRNVDIRYQYNLIHEKYHICKISKSLKLKI